VLVLIIPHHAAFRMVCIIQHCLLSEIEGFEVLAPVAVASIDQAKEAASRGVSLVTA
jgi:hypothetical protein